MKKFLSICFLILCIVFMSGCATEETASPEEDVSTEEAVDLSVNETKDHEEIQAVEQEPDINSPVVEAPLKEGYARYSDDVFGFMIDYPQDWGFSEVGGDGVVGGKGFDYSADDGSMASIIVFVHSNETNAKVWLQDEMSDIEHLKEIGVVSKFESVTINGREGVEIVYDPFKLLTGGNYEGPEYTLKMVVFDVKDYYYQVTALTNDYDMYGELLENSLNSFVIDEETMAL